MAILAILFGLTSFGQVAQSLDKKHSMPTDTAVISILRYDKNLYWIFNNAKQAEIADKDYELIESLLTLCLDNYNIEQNKLLDKENTKYPNSKLARKDFIIDITKYKRQYIVVTNNKGQKEVWVNCFCDIHHGNWKKDIVFVRDGGNCFFNLKINLTTKKYYDLVVNGEA